MSGKFIRRQEWLKEVWAWGVASCTACILVTDHPIVFIVIQVKESCFAEMQPQHAWMLTSLSRRAEKPRWCALWNLCLLIFMRNLKSIYNSQRLRIIPSEADVAHRLPILRGPHGNPKLTAPRLGKYCAGYDGSHPSCQTLKQRS